MHFKSVGAVFERVFDGDCFVREFFGRADGDEAGVKREGDGGGEEIAARFDADDDINGLFGEVVGAQGGNGFAKAGFVFEQRGDVVEVDAGFGKIGDFADELF